jgi:dienelactone hydrolase
MRHLKHRFLLLVLFLFATNAGAEVFTFRSEVQPTNLTATIGGDLAFPNGSGPFPVVILLHPCGGLDPIGLATLRAHAKELANVGFATYILDSYGPRNLGNGKACETFPTGSLRRGDAFNAMAALQRHPKVSKENIFLLGLSDGANAALLSAKGGAIGQFRAIAAYYPDCERLLAGVGYVYKSPTIVFVGERDDWTPPAECIKSKSPGVVTGAEFEVISYSNAHHGFDQQHVTRKYKGHTLAYSREATVDSQKRTNEFFIKHLTDELKTSPPFSGTSK